MTKICIDLLNSSLTVIGSGPLLNIISCSATEKLDEIGELSFSIPATDEKATYLNTAHAFKIYASDGFTKTGIIRNRTLTPGEQPTLTVSGPDLLTELVDYTCGWLANYNADQGSGVYGEDINTVVFPDLLTGTGWSAGTVDASLGLLYGTFNSMTRLEAIQLLRQRVGKHIRQGTTERTLDLGAFGTAHGIRFENFKRILRDQDNSTTAMLIDSLEEVTDKQEIVNLIIPFGAGEEGSYLISGGDNWGKVRLYDMLGTGVYPTTDVQVRPGMRGKSTTTTTGGSGTSLAVTSSTGFRVGSRVFIGYKTNADHASTVTWWTRTISSIPDGTHLVLSSGNYTGLAAGFDVVSDPQFYLYDSTEYAIAPREATVVFPDIDVVDRKSLGTNIAQFVPAAYALYLRAKEYLTTHKASRKIYSMSPVTIPYNLRVGHTVRVEYHGKVKTDGAYINWVDVSADLYVLSTTRTYNGDGSTTATLEVSDVLRQREQDAAMLANSVGDISVIKSFV